MKLYDTKMAPNPRRLRIFLAEKGIQVPDEQSTSPGAKPCTETLKSTRSAGAGAGTDDGTNLAESVAI